MWVWLGLACACGLVCAVGIGANDVANAFGASVGSGVLTLKQAYIVGAAFETLGALLLGGETSSTIGREIVMITEYNNSESQLMAGEVAVLVGGSLWIHFCTFLRLPISGTHTIVGATLGFCLFSRGLQSVNVKSMLYLSAVWVISPLLAGVISAALFHVIRLVVLNSSDPVTSGLRALPVFYPAAIFLNLLSIHTVDNSPVQKLVRWGFPLYTRLLFSGLVAAVVAVLVRVFFVPYMRNQITKLKQENIADLPYRYRSRLKADMNADLVNLFNLWPVQPAAAAASRRSHVRRRRRLHYKAVLRDNTQVFGAASMSQGTSRDFDSESLSSARDISPSRLDNSVSNPALPTPRISLGDEPARFPLEEDSGSVSSAATSQLHVRRRLQHQRRTRFHRQLETSIRRKTRGILKRSTGTASVFNNRCYSCPENVLNGSSQLSLDAARPMFHGLSTANRIWFSTPDIETEEPDAAPAAGRNAAPRLISFSAAAPDDNTEGRSRRRDSKNPMNKRILFTEPTPAELELFRDEINKRDKPECALIFKHLQIMTACFGAFAHGGNDVSNAVGPVITLFMLLVGGRNWTSLANYGGWDQQPNQQHGDTLFIISNVLNLMGGLGISVGLWVWGWRVMKTLGEDLTFIVPSSGFTIEVGAALTVLIASSFGIPVSTTHCKVAAVVGVGYMRTRRNVDMRILKRIATAWLVTVPAAATLAAVSLSVLQEFT